MIQGTVDTVLAELQAVRRAIHLLLLAVAERRPTDDLGRPLHHRAARRRDRRRGRWSSWSTSSCPDGGVPALVVAFVGLAVVAGLTVVVGADAGDAPSAAPTGVDDLTTFLDLLFVAIVALTLLFAPDYLEPRATCPCPSSRRCSSSP